MYTGILEVDRTLSARARTRFRCSARGQDPHGPEAKAGSLKEVSKRLERAEKLPAKMLDVTTRRFVLSE